MGTARGERQTSAKGKVREKLARKRSGKQTGDLFLARHHAGTSCRQSRSQICVTVIRQNLPQPSTPSLRASQQPSYARPRRAADYRGVSGFVQPTQASCPGICFGEACWVSKHRGCCDSGKVDQSPASSSFVGQ